MKKLLFLAVLLGAAFVNAQFQSDKISLYRHYPTSELTAASGNSCWGYVSPSGREYALMGCSNKVAFVEITDPTNCQYFASIPHSDGLWADVKVYQDVLYLATENSGTGVQVIDLSNIDNHQVTLVRTINSPGRSHTLNIDAESGFLYCVGTNESSGTTVCFNLADPRNPVQVGSSSLTGGNYIHECQVVTYTSGPYAGKQIMFGGGVQRGLEIYDVTDKNNVTLIRRVVYPFVGYCHQGWLSADRRYFYVNDEFDESNQGFNIRTLVFDVSVLETADLVATYSNDRPAIDHNIYTKNGFIFHSNYSTGLWIFDGNSNPTSPAYKGFFDTFPSDDRRDYVGAWSNYPYFPSGTVIVSDINGGMFVLDVSEATKTSFAVGNILFERGRVVSGGVTDVATQDNVYLTVAKGITVNSSEAPIRLVFEGTCLWTDISRIKFNLRHKVNSAGLSQTIELYDWTTSSWVVAQTGSAPTVYTTFTVTLSNPDRFVEPNSKAMRARLQIRATGLTTVADWATSIDLANWTINP